MSLSPAPPYNWPSVTCVAPKTLSRAVCLRQIKTNHTKKRKKVYFSSILGALTSRTLLSVRGPEGEGEIKA